MRWSIRIARVAGIDVRIHITFLLFLAWIGFSYYSSGGREAAEQGLLLVCAIFACVLLHEFGHAIAARAFGILTPDITLLPIGGVARLQRMPDKPSQELIVAAAGPLVNVVIAGVIAIYLGTLNQIDLLTPIEKPHVALLAKLATINVWLVLFNLIPAFPMDGGRVLRALLAMMLPYARATQVAAWIGQGLAFVFGFVGLFYNPMLIFIALFVYLGAQQESSLAQLKDVSHSTSVSEAMMTHLLCLPRQSTLDDAADALLRTAQHEFPVIDETGRPLGVLTRNDMIAALRHHGPQAPVIDFMHRDLPIITPEDSFADAFQKMQESACPAVSVVDRDGHFLGLITPENVGELMLVRSLLPPGGRPAWRPARPA
jgi:Zn-dependent protease/predicted transcriptional regulator